MNKSHISNILYFLCTLCTGYKLKEVHNSVHLHEESILQMYLEFLNLVHFI